MKTLTTALLVLILTISAFAERIPTAKYAGTAGAGVSTIRGGDARWVNPALLGLSGGPERSIMLPSGGYRLGNNALKSSDMDKWFQQDRYWTQSERDAFAGSVKSEFAMLGLFGGGAGYQQGAYSGAVDVIGAIDAHLPKNVIQLMVSGNQPGVAYDLNSLSGGSFGALSINGSFAKSFHRLSWAREVSLGLTVRYLIGLGYGGIRNSEGRIYTNVQPDTVSLHGYIVSAYSTSGDGVGLDVGAAARMDNTWGWSFALMNIAGRISWDKTTIRANKFNVDAQGIPVDSLTQTGFFERWSSYQSYPISESGVVDTKLPTTVLGGADYRLDRDWLLLGSFEFGIANDNTTHGATDHFKLALGSEYQKFDMVPLRSGFAVGGNSGFEIDFGAGLSYGSYHADLAFGFENGILSSAKGYSFAFTQRIEL